MEHPEELNQTLFTTYVFLVKADKPVGPRDLMRGANLSSPSVAYRNLQRLIDMGLVAKDEYGNYVVKRKVALSGYFWVGKRLVPRFAVFGVVAMKPLFAKTSNLITCLYQPSLSLVSQEPELKALLGESADEQVTNALRYVLSKDVAATIPGLRSIHEVEIAADVGDNYHGLTPAELKRFTFELGDYCRDCGLCMPCPQKINIPAILRFQSFAKAYGLKEWAKKLYGGLEVKADKCTGCGECEGKCPYGLSIQEQLRKAHAMSAGR